MSNINKLLIPAMLSLCSACNADTPRITVAPDNNEAVRLELKKSYEKGAQGIPELLRVLAEGLKNPYNLTSYSSVNHSINYLYLLAKKGITHEDVLPHLIEALKKQIAIKDTYLTAETIRIVTGENVGYSRNFVDNYSSSDEQKRQEMIGRWERHLK